MIRSDTLIVILATTAIALPVVLWLGLRLYVTAAAIGCRRCRRLSESERSARCMIPASVLEQLEKTGSSMRWSLIGLLVLLTALWLLGTTAQQRLAVDSIGIAALVCGGLFVLIKLTAFLTRLFVPSALSCRTKMLAAIKTSGKGIGWMIAAYAVVHLLLTMG